MDVFAEIVKNLLVIIVVSSFLEILLPDGNMKPFVRFAIGLFVLIAVLSPTLAFLYDNRSFQVKLWDYQVDKNIGDKIQENGLKINEQIVSNNSEQMKEKIAGQVSAVAILVPGVDDVHTEVTMAGNGEFKNIQLIVRPRRNQDVQEIEKVNIFSTKTKMNNDEQEEIERKIFQVMSNLYGVKKDDIQIKFEGG